MIDRNVPAWVEWYSPDDVYACIYCPRAPYFHLSLPFAQYPHDEDCLVPLAMAAHKAVEDDHAR